MDKERIERYKDKIDLGLDRLSKIEDNIMKFDDEFSRLAIYKAFQELVEALTDIIAMILIDNDKGVGDDYVNIGKIAKIIGFEDKEIEVLNEANGLRNRVIHEYNKTDDERAKESIERLIPNIREILEKISRFIKTKNEKTKD